TCGLSRVLYSSAKRGRKTVSDPFFELTRRQSSATLVISPAQEVMLRKFVVVVCLAAAASGGRAAAQDAMPVFKASVALVPISVVVRDSHGRQVTALQAADFQVLDNGQPRQIIDFQTDERGPVTIAVLVDTSGSMRLDSKRDAARHVVNE